MATTFEGTWQCRRISPTDGTLETFVLTVNPDSGTDPNNLDGFYSQAGMDVTLFGPLSLDGQVWTGATNLPQPSNPATFAFLIAADGQSFGGIWTVPGYTPTPWTATHS